MTGAADVAAAVDEFLRVDKTLVGVENPGAWGRGYNPHEAVLYLPLEIGGEQTGAQLMVVGFPEARELRFRLGLLFPGAVCRLDFTDETHPNTQRVEQDEVPDIVVGPHYHSWRANRRFCRGGNLPTRLHNAEIFDTNARSFDAILRWFCADTRIVGLPAGHAIQLPGPERLL